MLRCDLQCDILQFFLYNSVRMRYIFMYVMQDFRGM